MWFLSKMELKTKIFIETLDRIKNCGIRSKQHRIFCIFILLDHSCRVEIQVHGKWFRFDSKL